jgi:hypothetical protein
MISRNTVRQRMRKPTTILSIVAAFALGGLASAFALLAPKHTDKAAPLHPVWHEVSWPFAMDQWGKGTAFRCDAADCGADIGLYLRAKVGFCRCGGGLKDDADLDRVSDLDLFGGALYAQAPGQPLQAGRMSGRSRPFAIRDGAQRDATMISIGIHDNCDALVASAVLPRGALATAEPAVQQFLGSKAFADWAATTLGL